MELTQKGEMVSRLQAKAGQIGKILNNLEKYNHLLKDEKKSLEHKTPPDKKNVSFIKTFAKEHSTPIKDDASNSKDTNNVPEGKKPISSDSTDSFVKLELDLKLEDGKE